MTKTKLREYLAPEALYMFSPDPQEKAVLGVNIKARWRVAVPTLLLPCSHHRREGLINLWYLPVDDRAELFFQPILWGESKAIMQIPAKY